MIRWFFIYLITSLSVFADSSLIYEAQKKDIQLTDKDKETLEIGEISTARYVTGGILGTYPLGLGIGHAIQGRWSEQGYIFTWGELGSLGAVVIGAVGCLDEDIDGDENWKCSGFDRTLIVAGVIGFVGFRIWEVVDVWAAPPSHNKKFKKLKQYIEESKVKPMVKSSLDLVPVVSPKLGQGIGLRYVF